MPRLADVVARALAAEGARWAFGIPGTHNLELFDALASSATVEPFLVNHELHAAFMADGVSRTSPHVGVVLVVPGAGVTHALSGVAEAFLDNVPMVVLATGVRRDTGRAYQLHDIDQESLLRPITKAVLIPEGPAEIYTLVRRAFALARRGPAGPVAVILPAELFMATAEEAGALEPEPEPLAPSQAALESARELIARSQHPVLYLGYGARGAGPLLVELAEKLDAPVVTTIQGKGVFPERHPLWLWNGFGTSAPAFVSDVMAGCDCLVAIGCRFGEVATGSYGVTVPEQLVHVDVDHTVFNRNYPAAVAVRSDAEVFVRGLLPLVEPRRADAGRRAAIAKGHSMVRAGRLSRRTSRVSPARLFESLQELAGPDAIYVVDSGNGAFLAVEHLRVSGPGRFIGPIDFSCMGYAVPAAIGAKLANPTRPVIAIEGDGALLMNGLELLTASRRHIAPIVCVLRDGKLGLIAQLQDSSLEREVCSALPGYDLESLARTTACEYVAIGDDSKLTGGLVRAIEMSRAGRPVLVGIDIDYDETTFFARGILRTNFERLPLHDRMRVVARLLGRRLGRLARGDGGMK